MRIIGGLTAAAPVAATAAACTSPHDTRYGAYNSGYYYRTSDYYPSGAKFGRGSP